MTLTIQCSLSILSVIALLVLIFLSLSQQQDATMNYNCEALEVNAFRQQRQYQHRVTQYRSLSVAKNNHQQHRNNYRMLVAQMLPPLPSSFEYDDEVVFYQRATGTRSRGRESIRRWEKDFQTAIIGDGNDDSDSNGNGDGDSDINNIEKDDNLRNIQIQTSISTRTSPTTLLMRWNCTYVDPSKQWLVSLADTIPGWEPEFRSYVDQKNIVRTFSYKAVFRLFRDAAMTGKLRVPLACIEGTSICEFIDDYDDDEGKEIVDHNNNDNNDTSCNVAPTIERRRRRKIHSIVEDLAYAQDLNRGALENRICAQDLQFFLEVARKPLQYETSNNDSNNTYWAWEDHITSILPWKSVPGMMDPLYIEAQSKEDGVMVPLSFGIFSIMAVLLFANTIAPNLIGQSLFGSPTYMASPSELNYFVGY